MVKKRDDNNRASKRAHSAVSKLWKLAVRFLAGQRGAGDRIVRARLAMATFLSAMMAAVAAGYAASFLVSPVGALIVALGWGVMIATLDTMLVALMGERVGLGRWLVFLPRLPIIVLSGAVFVELIILRVFTPEVQAHLQEQRVHIVAEQREKIEAHHHAATLAKDTKVSTEIAEGEKTLAGLQAQIKDADERRRQAGREAIQAVRSRRIYRNADGEIYIDSAPSRATQAEEQRLARESEKLREELMPEMSRARAEIEHLRSEQVAEQAHIDKVREDDLAALSRTPVAPGLIAHLIALEEICAVNASARWARILLGLLLMGVELVPTFAKLGERSEATFIRERMHRILISTLQNERLEERLSLWMETNAHRYV